ncbi:putative peptidase C1-like protein F26E4.3 [Orchesella cincta]|uniref:Putative peptidase C1-like protein F26E4.3 n=1 Tax=Orchesella cincta TaxID=48709 RepID=A0A1D2MJK0_ORCCI|nr:putative peptidase C1-like protein F26E4.3 [Orchesella cincta]
MLYYNDRCFYNGQYYDYGATVKINCNQCKCERSPSDPSEYELLCERDPCIIEPNLIQTLNEGDYSWSASNYSELWGRKLADGLLYKLGTLEPERGVKNMEPIKFVYDESSIPDNFDARTKWPNLIHPIQDQVWCGSDWAFTTTAITADRLAIQSKGVENVKLSPQHLISCNSRGQQGCQGGHLDRAWNFMRKFGVVDAECYPYESGSSGAKGNCMISRKIKSLLEINQCRSANLLSGRTDLYRSQPAYRISSRENDIKYEIMTYGPVQAVMSVSPDFFMYRGGVYKKSGLRPADRTGYHSVRIIGWGEEFHQGSMLKYWLVANTWGSNWGESGHFKIARGENECDIETFIIAAWARPANRASYRNDNPFRF